MYKKESDSHAKVFTTELDTTAATPFSPVPPDWQVQLLPLAWNRTTHPLHWFRTGAMLTRLDSSSPSLHKRLPSTCPNNDVRWHKITFESCLWPLLATAKLNTVLARPPTPLLYVVYKRIYYGENT